MILADILSLCLRIGELVFSAIVVGLTASWLHANRGAPAFSHKRFIYTVVIASLALLFALIFLFPFAGSFIHWPLDLVLFAATMIAFGLLASYVGRSCGSIWNWGSITNGSGCDRFKADLAFLFLASIFFLTSALLGMYVVRKHRRGRQATIGDKPATRKWYRNRH